MSNFHVGQEVVCVDDRPTPLRWPKPPTKGAHYTVTELRHDGEKCILINVAEHTPTFGWYAHRFRPVRKTSIEIFTSMLNPAPNKKERETV